MICHCLLIETEQGLVLVDTGFGTEDIKNPKTRLPPMIKLIGATLQTTETAVEQIRALGFDPRDVKHIVATHMDMDHVGGVSDFPQATVHVLQSEYDAANATRKDLISKSRYFPTQWSNHKQWEFYNPTGGDNWNGFEVVRQLKGLPPEILVVPLLGHTAGHAGVAIQNKNEWIFHAGDAYFYRAEMDASPSCPTFLKLFQRALAHDNKKRLHNQARLRALSQSKQARVFSAHDAIEFESFNTKN